MSLHLSYYPMAESESTSQRISRRKFIGGAIVSAALGSGYYFGIHRRIDRSYTLKNSRKMMGTIVNFTIIGPDKERCNQALDTTIAHMEERGSTISTYNPESDISKLNRQGFIDNADSTLIKVVSMALEMSRLTEGAFDPTVFPLLGLYRTMKKEDTLPPRDEIARALSLVDYRNVQIDGKNIRYTKSGMAMTLDGIGKGYIVDEGVRIINSLGFANVCIEAGGDLMVTGTKKSGAPWTIAIRNPRPDKGKKQYVLSMKDRAIATSGDYMQSFSADRKYHHIINPVTGFSPPELASCSILAPSVAMADGLATSAMVMGHAKSIALLETLPGCEGFLIGKDLTTYTSEDFFS